MLSPTRPTGFADGRRLSHRIGRARLCRGTSRALTEPLLVLYRGSVARDRRRCDHGFLRWGRRTQSNVCLLQHSSPLPAPPASLARPGAPFGTVKPPALAPSRSDAIRPPPSTPALPADNTRRYVHSFAGGPGPIGPARCGIHPSARNESSANFVLFAHPRAASWLGSAQERRTLSLEETDPSRVDKIRCTGG
jgi:hypothetical protein